MATKKKTTTAQEPTQTEETTQTMTEPTPEQQEPQEAPAIEQAAEPEQTVPTCPYETTIGVSLAVLRKSVGPGTEEMLKPVATLKQGTKVTITAINGQYAQLRNGLWISRENLAK